MSQALRDHSFCHFSRRSFRALPMARPVLLCVVLVFSSCHRAPATYLSGLLLPPWYASILRRPCSRPGPPPFDDTWQPSETDLALLNSRLPRLTRLRARCCIKGQRIRDLRHYSLHYLPIVHSGHQLIYIVGSIGGAVDVCDGGGGYWGALNDPATGTFSDLNVNGVP